MPFAYSSFIPPPNSDLESQDVDADERAFKESQEAERQRQAKTRKVQDSIDRAREQNAQRKMAKVQNREWDFGKKAAMGSKADASKPSANAPMGDIKIAKPAAPAASSTADPAASEKAPASADPSSTTAETPVEPATDASESAAGKSGPTSPTSPEGSVPTSPRGRGRGRGGGRGAGGRGRGRGRGRGGGPDAPGATSPSTETPTSSSAT